MTDIKLPPMPQTIENRLSDFAVACAFGQHELRASAARELRQAINEHAREAVRLNAQAVPDGWKLVPVEPTDEMVKVGDQKTWVFPSRGCWTAMLSAAPAAPQPAQQDAKPIYQYQLATGGWIDQTRDSYEYNKANGVKGLRIVYEAAHSQHSR